MGKAVKVEGIRVVVGGPVSTDGGLVFVAREIRRSEWFGPLVARLREGIEAFDGERYGFASEEKVARGLLALVCGLAMGYRSGKEMADVIAGDRLWREVLGKRVTQPDLSRLVDLMSKLGVDALKEALLTSASAGLSDLHLDGDSSLLELHGKQEGGAYNGHYQEFGYHAGWMIESHTGRLAALWLNDGNEHTATGQAEVLEGILASGRKVGAYRGDAGMPSPRLMALLDEHGTAFVMRLKTNARLEAAAETVCPAGPWRLETAAFGEFRHAVKSWGKARRVAVKFQAPHSKDGAACLFLETFFFVTSRTEAPQDVVSHYLQRGEAERTFGEFLAAFEPTFRHAEKAKNEVWAQFLGLAHNVLVDLRDRLPMETEPKRIPALKPLQGEPSWVSTAFHTYVHAPVKTTLSRFRAFALKLANGWRSHAGYRDLRLHPTFARPAWPDRLLTA